MNALVPTRSFSSEVCYSPSIHRAQESLPFASATQNPAVSRTSTDTMILLNRSRTHILSSYILPLPSTYISHPQTIIASLSALQQNSLPRHAIPLLTTHLHDSQTSKSPSAPLQSLLGPPGHTNKYTPQHHPHPRTSHRNHSQVSISIHPILKHTSFLTLEARTIALDLR